MRPAIAVCLGALTIAMVQRLLAMVFVLNFDVDGPNATAVLAALLVTAPMALVPITSRAVRAALATAAVAGAIAAAWAPPTAATLGAAMALLATTPLWRAVPPETRVEGAVVGALLWMAATALMGGLSPWVAAPWLAVVLALPLGTAGRPSTDGGIAGPWAFLLLQAVFLGSPVVWRWGSLDPVWTAAAAAGGLAVGLWTRPARPGPQWATAVLLVAMIDLLWTGWLGPGAALLAQLGAVWSLSSVGGTWRLLVVQATGVVLVFLHVVASNWAFVGFIPEALSRGRAAWYLLLLSLLLPLAAWRPARGGRGA